MPTQTKQEPKAPEQETPAATQRDIPAELITKAEKLLAAKASVLADLQECRIMLNMFSKQGLLTDEQAKFVADKLPRKQRKSKDDADESTADTAADNGTAKDDE